MEYKFNDRKILLIRIDNLDVKKSKECFIELDVSTYFLLYNRIVEFAISEFGNYIEYIVYSIKQRYINQFPGGMAFNVKLHASNRYTKDAVQLMTDLCFKNECPALFRGRLEEKYALIYLESLRLTLICTGANRTEQQARLYAAPQLYLDELKERLASMNNDQLAAIVHTINSNEINLSVHPNVFNLIQTEPRQQNALNIKKISTQVTISDVDDTCIIYNKNEEISQGFFYISDNTVVHVNIKTNLSSLTKWIAQNYVFSFNIIASNLDEIDVIVAIPLDVYPDFKQKKDANKLPLQFTKIDYDKQECIFLKKIVEKVWQSGNDHLFNAAKFSKETLKTDSRLIQVYGVFCRHVIDEIVEKTRCSFQVMLVSTLDPFKYYYVNIFFNKMYTATVFDILIKHGNESCIKLDDNMTLLQQSWTRRRCSTLIYHTYFNFGTNAMIEARKQNILDQKSGCADSEKFKVLMEDIVDAFQTNLIHFKYITITGRLHVKAGNASDGYLMGDIMTTIRRAIARDREDYKLRISTTPLHTKKNGGLVGVTSERTIEKLAFPGNIDQVFGVYSVYEHVLLNYPLGQSVNSEKNAIMF